MKVIIVGGGFGGLKLARRLNNKRGFEVLLIDRFNYHQFQPLFYQVATAGLDASNISFPLRKAFQRSKNIRIRLTDLEEIVASENKIITATGEEYYDILVLATGADTNFFNNEQLEKHALPMKSTVEALQLRYKLIQNFEDALTVKSGKELERLMNVVVVGGGPTGVELSGALADMKRFVLPKDYPELDFSRMNIFLLEGTDKLLGHMSQRSSQQSKKYLERLGVNVLTGAQVRDYDGKVVYLQDGQTIPSATVLWAAGIKGNIPNGIDQSLIARGNRIRVDRFNRVIAFKNVYAIGDLAFMETPAYPNGHPQVATVAIQQAGLLSINLERIRNGRTDLQEYEYRDKGSMATVGRNLAVVDIPKPKLHFGGWFAWMVWMTLHLMLILGVKNRFFVFINWLYNYITYDQSLRLIFREYKKHTATEKIL
ncbi:MAG TPA: FAD-dependent oxidoreductase [Chitinophagaceae bacterium]|nr:FAD-dependent oxidoreductase [Chitinophagaceae bacterium]